MSAPQHPSSDTASDRRGRADDRPRRRCRRASDDALVEPAVVVTERRSADESDEDEEDEDDDGDPLVREGDVAGDYLERLLDILDVDGDIDLDVEGDRARSPSSAATWAP